MTLKKHTRHLHTWSQVVHTVYV